MYFKINIKTKNIIKFEKSFQDLAIKLQVQWLYKLNIQRTMDVSILLDRAGRG